MNVSFRVELSSLYQLPVATLVKIAFEYLEFRDFIKLDAVSTFFRRNLANQLFDFKILEEQCIASDIFFPGYCYTNDMLGYIAKVFKNIISFTSNVRCKHFDVSASGLIELVYRCKFIEVVDYSLQTMPRTGFETWTRFALNNTADFKNLQYLGLHNSINLDDINMEDICFHIRSLVTLDIGDCQGFTDAGLTWIATCQPGLEHLDIGTHQVRRRRMHLDSGDCNERITNVGLAALAKGCRRLKSFIIRNNLPLVDSAITEEHEGDCWAGLLSIINNCQELELLDISMDDPHTAFLDDRDDSEYNAKAWKYMRCMKPTVLESILGLPHLRVLHLGGISTPPKLNMFRMIWHMHSESLKWVGLQQTQLISLTFEENPARIVTRCCKNSSDELISHWNYKVKTAFQVYHDGELSELRICYGFHNYQRNKEKRWLKWPMDSNDLQVISDDY